jgi:hypothetical protein
VCFYYYKLSYTFETNLETFDKFIPAVGTRTLLPRSLPFIRTNYAKQKDVLGENEEPLALNRIGAPADPEQPAYIIDVNGVNLNPGQGSLAGPLIQKREIAKQGNLLLLGIPTEIN